MFSSKFLVVFKVLTFSATNRVKIYTCINSKKNLKKKRAYTPFPISLTSLAILPIYAQ